MPLRAGDKVGAYEILGTLGAGGMGEVYRANDPRLKREVAIKVLPVAVRDDASRLRRFEQEARATSGLNHPNVLAVYDVGEHDGAPYLVTELLEGASLRERLKEGPLPWRKALDLGRQIAAGLAAAHDKDIVHRDLKPENLFVAKDGRVKILDFGLAKGLGGEASTDGATLTASEPGAVLGTAGYMAPEQVRGQPADERSDIFAFGAVLYEMLSGKRAFDGETSVERGHAILKQEPAALGEAGAVVPAGVERAVRRCLEKAPDERFQSARDLGFALEALGEASGTSGPSSTLAAPRRRRVSLVLAALIAVATLAVGLAMGRWVVYRAAPAATAPASEPAAPVLTWTRVTFRSGFLTMARFAPDGRTIVYSGVFGGEPPRVFSTVPGTPDARPVTEPWYSLRAVSSREEALVLRMRPPSELSFAGTLSRVSLAGGSPREVLDGALSADFGPDGESLAAILQANGLTRLEYPIGNVLYETRNGLGIVRVSPRGDRVAIVENPAPGDTRSTLLAVGVDVPVRRLARGLIDCPAWSPDGREVWFASYEKRATTVRAVTLEGEERTLVHLPGSASVYDVARDGRALVDNYTPDVRVVAALPEAAHEVSLSWLDATVPVGLSADGRLLLFREDGDATAGEPHAYVRGTDGSPAVHLGAGRPRALSPDGKWALLSPNAPYNTLSLVPTGAGMPRALEPGNLEAIASAAWFRDGKRILLAAREQGKDLQVWIQDLAAGPPRPIGEAGVAALAPPSPDGRFVPVTRPDNRSVLFDLTTGESRPLEGLVAGDQPLQWSEDGKELFVWRVSHTRSRMPVTVTRYDIATGKHRPWREIGPTDLIGVHPAMGMSGLLLTSTGVPYVYWYVRGLSSLYLVEGLR